MLMNFPALLRYMYAPLEVLDPHHGFCLPFGKLFYHLKIMKLCKGNPFPHVGLVQNKES